MTDGACLNNGQPNPKAGWAFMSGRSLDGKTQVASGRLEQKGPWGDSAAQTSNRAELRAVIAALRFRIWSGEGFRRIVIATDSEYVVQGSTEWAKTWIEKKWRIKNKKASGYVQVANKDLWQALLGEYERAFFRGMKIQLWKIPREWNADCDEAAKKAAAGDEQPDFGNLMGLAI
jgi:ribonuclease HI